MLDSVPFFILSVLPVLSQHRDPMASSPPGSLSQELLLEAWAAGGEITLSRWGQVGVGDSLRTRRRTQMGDKGRDVPSGSRTAPKEELKNSPSE